MLRRKQLCPNLFPARTYSSTEVAEFAQVTLRQLQWWDERKVVMPRHEGHKRVYGPEEVIEIAVIAELRRKGSSLQSIRHVFRFLQREMRRRLQDLLSLDSEFYLLTDVKSVHMEDRYERIIELLKSARKPIYSMNTQIELCSPPRPLSGPRPKRSDPDVIGEAARMLLPRIMEYLGNDDYDEAEIFAEITELFNYWDLDGYALARELKRRHHWDPDAELVRILDSADTLLENAYQRAVGQWITAFSIQPALNVGTTVKIFVNRKEHEGVIAKITDPEAAKYKQVVLFGIRRARYERERLKDHEFQVQHNFLCYVAAAYAKIQPLGGMPDRIYAVPEGSAAVRLIYSGLPLDAIEDLLPCSGAYHEAVRTVFAPPLQVAGRPLTPLHEGHAGILSCSGLLNGVFGQGELRHVACWQSSKKVDRIEDTDEHGVTTIRDRERFTQSLTLIYADGCIAELSEDNDNDGKCAPATGQT